MDLKHLTKLRQPWKRVKLAITVRHCHRWHANVWIKQNKNWNCEPTVGLRFGGALCLWLCVADLQRSEFCFSGTRKKVADFQYNAVRVDNWNTAQVAVWPRGQAVRFGGITSEEVLLCGGWKESRAGPVKHAAGVSYRLDIHDHCRLRQSVYGHFERGLESESLCSVSGEGFLREITFHSFSAAHYSVVLGTWNL